MLWLCFHQPVHVVFWFIQDKFSFVTTGIDNLFAKEIWFKDKFTQTVANWGHRPCHDAIALSVRHSEPTNKVQNILPLNMIDWAAEICLQFRCPLFTYAATKFGYLAFNQRFLYILRIVVKFRIKQFLQECKGDFEERVAVF